MIYICYGVTKSASTYLYQLTEELFCVAGRRVGRLPDRLRQCSVFNFVPEITGTFLKDL
jgi:hypothetical protein